ncbi:MAG TPA: helix-turn-helix transcriptional regulator [Solirubrobacterales bacterium]|nr:helix-turn-helix transcriptional regulator [Solirubrobacterales bacterium]
MDRIGDTLRQARESRGIDLDEVARVTKIRPRFLAALEAEQWDALPGRAYVLGFLRTYAEYLGLDPTPLSEQLGRELDRIAPLEAPPEPVVQQGTLPQGRWRGVGVRLAAVLVAVAAVAAALVIALGGGEDQPESASPPPAPAPEEEPAEPEPEVTAPEPAEPERVSVELEATGTVWVCLVSAGGEALVEGETLATGETRGPFEARRVLMSLGNHEVELTANGEPVELPPSPDPIGLELDSEGSSELDEADRPTCV